MPDNKVVFTADDGSLFETPYTTADYLGAITGEGPLSDAWDDDRVVLYKEVVNALDTVILERDDLRKRFARSERILQQVRNDLAVLRSHLDWAQFEEEGGG